MSGLEMTLIVSCLATWVSLVRVERQSLRTPEVEDGRALRRYREPRASRAKNAAHPVFDRTSGIGCLPSTLLHGQGRLEGASRNSACGRASSGAFYSDG